MAEPTEILTVFQWFGDPKLLEPCPKAEKCLADYGLVCPGKIDGRCCFGGRAKTSKHPELKEVREVSKSRIDKVVEEIE